MSIVEALWHKLSHDAHEKIVIALLSSIISVILTAFIPKVVWPFIRKSVKAGVEFFYHRFSGYPLLHSWARSRYVAALQRVLQRVDNPWSSERHTLGHLFVPIKVDTKYQIPHFVAGEKKAEQVVTLRAAIQRYRIFVLVGAPGGGKTTALKSIGLTALDGGLLKGHSDQKGEDVDPVWIELRRFPARVRSLFEQIVQTYADYGFPNASTFVTRRLEKKSLLLLLDGLDEVSEDELGAVLEAIRIFAEKYPDNRMVASCRTANYERQLDDLSQATVALAAFNEIQIAAYLRHRAFPPGKSAVQLMTLLRERPQINVICRNPLLLTIISSLYAETDYDLPSSRTEFYETCIDALMRRWDFRREIDRKNKFQAGLKGRVLERVALNLQKRSESARDVSERELIALISDALPDLGLASTAAEDVLREVIRNSGIMIYVAPAKLRFAHLTFQEFFAAREIEATSSEQIMLPAVAPNWREVAILFCGISKRAGTFVSQLKEDPKLAAACIAESVAVPFSVADRVLDRLELESKKDPAYLVSIASLAVDTKKPWAARAFALLRTCISDPDRSISNSAIWALATVPTPDAAELLVQALTGETEQVARDALKQVGTSALPALQGMLRSNVSERIAEICLELCAYVPTPEVIDLLLPILWSPKPSDKLPFAAGRSLGVLLRDPTIEEAIRLTKKRDVELRLQESIGHSPEPAEFSLDDNAANLFLDTVAQQVDRKLNGSDIQPHPIWPFQEEDESILPAAVRTIVSVLAVNDYRQSPDQELLDPRIAIPLSIILREKGTPETYLWELVLPIGGISSLEAATMPVWVGGCFNGPVEALWRDWVDITSGSLRNRWVGLLQYIQRETGSSKEPGEFTQLFGPGLSPGTKEASRPNPKDVQRPHTKIVTTSLPEDVEALPMDYTRVFMNKGKTKH